MALDLNGSTDRIDYAQGGWDGDSDFSLTGMFYPDVLSGQQTIFAGTESSALAGWLVDFSSGSTLRVLQLRASVNRSHSWNNAMTTGSWQHLVIRTSNTTSAAPLVYVDGSWLGNPDSSTVGVGAATANSSGVWSVGGRDYTDTVNFNGRVADFGVWDKILSASEDDVLFKTKNALTIPDGLILFAPMFNTGYIHDIVGGRAGTLDGVSNADHPSVIRLGSLWVPSLTATAGGTDVTINAAVQSLTASIPAYTQSADFSLDAAVQSVTVSVPAYTTQSDFSLDAAVQSVTVQIPVSTVTIDTTVDAATQSIVVSVPAYSVNTGDNQTINASVQSLAVSIPASSLTIDTSISAAVQSLVVSVPAYTTSADFTFSATTQGLVVSIPTYSVDTGTNQTINANVLSLSVSIPTYDVYNDETIFAAVQNISVSIPAPTIIVPATAGHVIISDEVITKLTISDEGDPDG